MGSRYGWSGRGSSRYNDRGYGQWAPYVPVAKRRANAERLAKNIAKSTGRSLQPIHIEGRKIATSFWGQAWCDHMEQYCDYSNRLPRGRTYVRNGSVIDLQIDKGNIKALVSGSDIYKLNITIKTVSDAQWKKIQQDCAQSISSLLDLLQGRFDQGVMKRLTRPGDGLFPQSNEIKMSCSCPDGAVMCKHVAAVLYGVGARLDTAPELLFTLRNVDHTELISEAASSQNLDRALGAEQAGSLASEDLGALFGIELESHDSAKTGAKSKSKKEPGTKKPGMKKLAQNANLSALPESASKTTAKKKPAATKKRPSTKKATAANRRGAAALASAADATADAIQAALAAPVIVRVVARAVAAGESPLASTKTVRKAKSKPPAEGTAASESVTKRRRVAT